MSSKPIPYGKQEITEADIQAVEQTLRSEFLTQGPKIKEFEDKFAAYVGARFGVAVANGTAALHLSALALQVKPGTKVITTPLTFSATANCVLYCGGDVEFADIDLKTACLDANRVEALLKQRPGEFQGIIPVDYAGYPVQMDDFNYLAKKYGLWTIEDACHAPGALYQDREGKTQKTGNANYSDLTIFSFHPAKHITCGEGGMITTNRPELYQKLQVLRTHGITKDPSQLTKQEGGWYQEMQVLGFNYRMPDMLCALGISQLNRVQASFERRQEIARRYLKELSDLPLVLPNGDSKVLERRTHAYHLYVIRTKRRKELYDFLRKENIFAQVHYVPVHLHPFYIEKYGHQTFENAESFYRECLSIPMFHSLAVEEQSRVIATLRQFFNGS